MKDYAFLIVMIIVAATILTSIGWVLWPKDKEPEQSISWIGSPVVGVEEEGGRYLSTPAITSREIGLRNDGVVVWRHR